MAKVQQRRGSHWRASLREAGRVVLDKAKQLFGSRRLSSENVVPKELLVAFKASKNFVSPKGVSVDWLQKFWNDILEEKVVSSTKLFVARENLSEDVPKGTTLRTDGFVPGVGKIQYTGGQIALKPRREWTIGDVCDFVVVPQMETENAPFVETLSEEEDEAGAPFEGAYVSYSRDCLFGDLVSAMRDLFKDSEEECFVWLDIFCSNQVALYQTELSKEQTMNLAQSCRLFAHEFDDRVLFVESWIKPRALSNIWCIWELFCALESKKGCNIALPSRKKKQYLELLNDDPNSLLLLLSDISLSDATFSRDQDEVVLKELIERNIGWDDLKDVVVEKLSSWLLEACENVVKRLDASENESSVIFGRLLNQAAIVMYKAGQFDVAESYFKRSLNIEIASEERSEDGTLGKLYRNLAGVFEAQGKLKDAVTAYQECFDLEEKDGGKEAIVLAERARLLVDLGRAEEAVRLYERSEVSAAVDNSGNKAQQADILGRIAEAYETLGDSQRALQLHHRCFQILNESPESRLGAIKALQHIGALAENQGNFAMALQQYKTAIVLLEEECEGDSTNISFLAPLTGLGRMHEKRNELSQALEAYEWCLRVQKANGDQIGGVLSNIANVKHIQGDLRAALSLYLQSLEILVGRIGMEDHPDVAVTMNNIALIYDRLGETAKALDMYKKAMEIFQNTSEVDTKENKNVAKVQLNMARALQSLRKHERAEELYKNCLEIVKGLDQEDLHLTSRILSYLGSLYEDTGEFQKALETYELCLQKMDEAGDQVSRSERATITSRMARTFTALEEFDQALKLHEETLELEKGQPHTLGVTLSNMATVYRFAGKHRTAIETYEKSLETFRTAKTASGNFENPTIATILYNMAVTYFELGENDEAKSLAKSALKIQKEVLGANHSESKRTAAFLTQLKQHAALGKGARLTDLLNERQKRMD